MIAAILIILCSAFGFIVWCCCRVAAMSDPLRYIYVDDDLDDDEEDMDGGTNETNHN